jgi:hypothetical protein
MICYRVKKDGELHLACFNCQVFGEMRNVEVCMDCAEGTGLLRKKNVPKVK